MSFGSLDERRKAFSAITKHLVDRFGFPQEPDISAQYREAALTNAGLHFSGQVAPLVASDDVPSSTPEKERFLDSEFVAIYW
jgi:hypothetical protein